MTCPYKEGYDCPYRSYGFNSCTEPDSDCYKRGEKIFEKRLTNSRTYDIISTESKRERK